MFASSSAPMRVLAGALVVTLSGCAVTTMQTAETLGEGGFQFTAEPGVRGVAGGGTVPVAPAFNLAGRYGVSDRLDVGLRVGTVVYEVNAKVMLRDQGTLISVVPSGTLGGVGGGGAGAVYLTSKIPLLIGVPMREDDQLVFGPFPRFNFVLGGGGGGLAAGVGLDLGLTVGYSTRVTKLLRIQPEIGLEAPLLVAGATAGQAGVAGTTDVLLFGVSVGFLVGGP